MRADREPTADQLLAMAYADGELAPDERSSFELRLTAEPELAREVAEYRSLQVMARQMAPPEPMDHEWRRIELDAANRGIHFLGWSLFVLGALGLSGFGVWGIATAEGELLPRALAVAVIFGLLLLLLGTVRNRLRTMPFDPYREIKR